MRFLFFVFCVLLSASCALQASLNHNPKAPGGGCLRSSVSGTADVANFYSSVVRVYSPVGACSGTQVAPHIIVTAQHCVSPSLPEPGSCTTGGPTGDSLGMPVPAAKITVIGDKGTAHGKAVFVPVAHDTCGSDFAVIIVDEQAAPDSTPVRMSNETLAGEKSVVVGFGLSPSTHFGVRHYRDVQVLGVGSGSAAPNELYTGVGAFPGDSGGALLSAETGALIGITSKLWYRGDFDFNNPTGLSVFTQSQQLTSALFAAMAETGEFVRDEIAGQCD